MHPKVGGAFLMCEKEKNKVYSAKSKFEVGTDPYVIAHLLHFILKHRVTGRK